MWYIEQSRNAVFAVFLRRLTVSVQLKQTYTMLIADGSLKAK